MTEQDLGCALQENLVVVEMEAVLIAKVILRFPYKLLRLPLPRQRGEIDGIGKELLLVEEPSVGRQTVRDLFFVEQGVKP